MLQAVGYNTEGKGLDLCLSFLCCLPVCENPWQTHDLRNPAPVFLFFDLKPESHGFPFH